ncbi:MAG TPA: hypothetical protein VGB63_11960 [Pedobacter sp.]|jgi:hypothetical protein
MKIFTLTFLTCFVLSQTFSQTQRKLSTYILGQYNNTLNDFTAGINPWALGVGLQAFYNNKSKFRPTLELSRDIYLYDDKVMRFVSVNPDGSFSGAIDRVSTMVNLFAGAAFQLEPSVYLSFVAGPSCIGKQTLLGVKPSIGFYLSEKQRWTAKVSYINVFNRAPEAKKGDFGSLSVGIGLKLF